MRDEQIDVVDALVLIRVDDLILVGDGRGKIVRDPLLGVGNAAAEQVADCKCDLVHVFGDCRLIVQNGGVAGGLRRAAEDQRWKHHEEQQRDRKDGEQRKKNLLPVLGCHDCDTGSRAVGTAEGGPICSCGRDLACFCGAFHDLCGGAADLNRFVQPGLTTIVYAHSSTKTTDMISCPVTG